MPLTLTGSATCVNLPQLANRLEQLPDGGEIRITFRELRCLDHTCAELIRDWMVRKSSNGTRVEYDFGERVQFRKLLAQH